MVYILKYIIYSYYSVINIIILYNYMIYILKINYNKYLIYNSFL